MSFSCPLDEPTRLRIRMHVHVLENRVSMVLIRCPSSPGVEAKGGDLISIREVQAYNKRKNIDTVPAKAVVRDPIAPADR